MRFLHSSDWHLGQRLCDRDRREEHSLFLSWLLDTAREQQADYLLLCGDIFDSAVPSNQSLADYYRFLASLPSAGIKGAVVCGGNHDSPAALAAPRALLEGMNIHVRGARSRNPEDDVVVFKDAAGQSVACALVPYLRERDVRSPKAGESIAERDAGIQSGIRDHYLAVTQAMRACRADAMLLTGHLFVAGSTTVGGERDLYVGNLGRVGSDLFASDVDYCALGHIHAAMNPGPGIRYCGSPLAMDFGETGRKSVTIVDIPGAEQEITVREIEIPEYRRLMRFKGTVQEIRSALAMLEAEVRTVGEPRPGELWPEELLFGAQTPGALSGSSQPSGALRPWAEAVVDIPVADTLFFEELEQGLKDLGIDLLRIAIKPPAAGDKDLNEGGNRTLEEISPEEMFELRCDRRGVEPDAELRLAFAELLAEMRADGAEVTTGDSDAD